jgi:hypothetical protein
LEAWVVTETGKSAILSECCGVNDLVRQKTGILLWCLPTLALVVGLAWTRLRPWLWIPAFLIMGVGCLVNALRCRRWHCYVTGPIFLLAAAYVVLAEFSVVPMRPAVFLLGVLGITALSYLAELPLGKYRKA